jgi:uncharacterized membrane protein
MRDFDRSYAATNVGDTERAVSVLAGAVLLTTVLSRLRLSSLVLTAIGGGLIYRGVTGWCHAYEALGKDSVEPRDEVSSLPTQVEEEMVRL